MHEGTGPYFPGTIAGDPEGVVAQALDSVPRPRPALRLIRGQVTARPVSKKRRVIRLDAERAVRKRSSGPLVGVALACAVGVIAGLSWCAGLVFLALKIKTSLGMGGAFLVAGAIQLLAIGVFASWARNSTIARSFSLRVLREGTPK